MITMKRFEQQAIRLDMFSLIGKDDKCVFKSCDVP